MSKLHQYYEQDLENDRLVRDNAHTLEYITTMTYLEKTLPAGCSILDACAGTGVYAFPLAEKGYAVTAGDFTPFHVCKIKEKQESKPILQRIGLCDVLHMPQFEDGQFDAVLCLGALYHLLTVEDRQQAVRECLRVLKPSGIFAAAYISRYAQVLVGLAREGAEGLDACLDAFDNGYSERWTTGNLFYRTTLDEFKGLMGSFDLEEIITVGTDGIGYAIPQAINGMDTEAFEKWVDLHLRTCEEPNILGYSLHGLYIGRKRQ